MITSLPHVLFLFALLLGLQGASSFTPVSPSGGSRNNVRGFGSLAPGRHVTENNCRRQKGRATHSQSTAWSVPRATTTAVTTCKTQLAATFLEPYEFSSLLMAFDTFDGSSVVDPVIVSGTFWGSLATKIVSVVIGQLIATLVFTVVFSVAASQLSGVLDRVSKGLVERILGPPPPKLRTPPPDYTGSSSSSSSSSSGSSTATAQIDLPKLALCLAIDVLGTSSEFLPIVGEFTDLVYAPVAATLLRSLYGSNVVFVLEFTEEILPFTDVIPLATICWVVDTLAPASGLARLMQLGDYRQGGAGKVASDDIVIDTATATTTSRILDSEKNRENGSFR